MLVKIAKKRNKNLIKHLTKSDEESSEEEEDENHQVLSHDGHIEAYESENLERIRFWQALFLFFCYFYLGRRSVPKWSTSCRQLEREWTSSRSDSSMCKSTSWINQMRTMTRTPTTATCKTEMRSTAWTAWMKRTETIRQVQCSPSIWNTSRASHRMQLETDIRMARRASTFRHGPSEQPKVHVRLWFWTLDIANKGLLSLADPFKSCVRLANSTHWQEKDKGKGLDTFFGKIFELATFPARVNR